MLFVECYVLSLLQVLFLSASPLAQVPILHLLFLKLYERNIRIDDTWQDPLPSLQLPMLALRVQQAVSSVLVLDVIQEGEPHSYGKIPIALSNSDGEVEMCYDRPPPEANQFAASVLASSDKLLFDACMKER